MLRVRDAIALLRTPLPSRGLPAPESAARRWLIRSIAVVALLVNAAYLVWRTTSTVDLGVWWVSLPLLVLEFHAALGIALFTFSLWTVDAEPPAAASSTRHAAGLPSWFRPTTSRTTSSSRRSPPRSRCASSTRRGSSTTATARRSPASHAKLGARYLTRPTHEHAKAGNINHALGNIKADFIAILDADHVASDSSSCGRSATSTTRAWRSSRRRRSSTTPTRSNTPRARARRASTSRPSSTACSRPGRTAGARRSGAEPGRSSG